MQRIEINVQTGEQSIVDLSPSEIAEAKARYDAWLLEEEARKAELPTQLQNQINALQAQLDGLK
jgi:hypothetical protein